MVDRTVSVGLLAQVGGYITGMKTAQAETMRLAEVAEAAANRTAAAQVGSQKQQAAALAATKKQLDAQKEAFTKLGTVSVAVGAIAAAGIGLIVKAAADYGARMAQLQALSHATTAEMNKLSDAAMTQGKAYGYSADQVADAEIELTKAGLSTAQILGGGLKSALALAAAGQLDVGQATQIATVAMTDFGLSAQQLPGVSDALSAGADKALGSVQDLGEGLANGGQQAHNMGLSVFDTIGTLSAFANAGIIGAEGGTQLRSMFIQLQRVTPQAQAVMDKYGISIYDAQGKFVGMTKLAGELHDKLGDLTQAQQNAALATIFGSHAITGASVIMNLGAKGMQAWIDKVHDFGFANAQAAGKLNSLQGDVQKLAATFQTDLIKAGTGADSSLRGVVQTMDGLLGAFGDAPGPIRDVATNVTVLVAGVGLLGGAALIAVPKIIEFKAALAEANISGKAAAGTFARGAGLAIGIAAIASGLANLGSSGVASSQQIEQAGIRIQHGWKGVNDAFSNTGILTENISDAKSALGSISGADFGGTIQRLAANWIDGVTGITGAGTHLGDFFKSNEETFDAMGQQLSGLAAQDYSASTRSFNDLVKQIGGGTDTVKQLLSAGVMPAFRSSLIDLAGKAHVSATEQNLLSIATGKGAAASKVAAYEAWQLTSSTQTQTAAMNGDATAINSVYTAQTKLAQAAQNLEGTEDSALDAVDSLTTALKANGATLDQNTTKGRANREAANSAAQAILAHAAAINSDGNHAADAAIYTDKMGVSLVKTMEQFHISKSAAEAYVGQLLGIPKGVTTEAALKTAEAEAEAKTLAAKLAAIFAAPIVQSVVVQQGSGGGGTRTASGHFASGGMMPNIGPKGKDSFLIAAASGEYMFRASTVDKAGGPAAMASIDHAIRNGSLRGYAAGGAVGDASKGLSSARSAEARAQKAETAAQNAYNRASKGGKDAARDKLDAAKSALDSAKSAVKDAQDRLTSLQQASEDFVSTQRRATASNPIDPLSYVDDLRSMSRDSNYSSKQQKTFDAAANKYESAIVKLTDKSQAAAQKLSDLKDASQQLHDSVASSISGRYDSSGAGAIAMAGGWVSRDGIQFQTTTTGYTAAGLDSYWKQSGSDASGFAAKLKQLAGRGVSGGVLAQIAREQDGPALADALLSASAGQISDINSGYASVQAASDAAGTTVADDTYQRQIDAAQKNADQITNQLKSDGEALRKLIASAFGLKGYASGTAYATPGLHLVGENGPELLRFAGGEQVWNAGQTRYIRGGGAAAARAQFSVAAAQVHMPDTITVQDLHGFRHTMQVVAQQEISRNADSDAVLLGGGRAL